MRSQMTVREYFKQPETMRPMELVYGVVREPPAPNYSHQAIVTRLAVLLDEHVRARRLGQVCVSPVDVVLDEHRALVVQPDVVFIAKDRADIARDRIWGAPDLVVEVLSPRTSKRDRTTKLGWYRKYGIKECWVVDPTHRQIEVVALSGSRPRRKRFARSQRVQSPLLPTLSASVAQIFS